MMFLDTDNLGMPLDGNYGMSFALYDAASAGDLVWGPEVYNAVPVSDGLFSLSPGSRTAQDVRKIIVLFTRNQVILI